MKKSAILRLLALLLLLGTAVGAAGCTPSAKRREYTLYDCFDTVSTVIFYGRVDDAAFARYCAIVDEVLHEYHELTDIYHEYEGKNNLATVNKNAGNPVAVDGKLLDLLTFAKEMYEKTDGYTNIAMGAVTSLWHDFREGRNRGEDTPLPTEAALTEAGRHTDIENVVLDLAAGTVTLADPLMSLDVGAVAKGYAEERLAEALLAAGASSFALDLGGSIRLCGKKPDGSSFRTAVRDPRGDGYAFILSVSDTAVVTSGDYERYAEVNGVRYSHIIDKFSLHPAAIYAAVTVICDDVALGDALSTALFCMTEEAGRALLAKVGADGVFIYPDGKISYTDGARARISEE